MSKVQAYVTSATCAQRRAFLPGDHYQGRLVSQHGDLLPWRYGKRTTIAFAGVGACDGEDGADFTRTAQAVCDLKGWRTK